MFSMCSELAPRAHIPDTRIPQLMQPWWGGGGLAGGGRGGGRGFFDINTLSEFQPKLSLLLSPPPTYLSLFKNQAPSKVKCHRTAFCRDQTVTERPVRPRVSAPAIVETLAIVFMCHTPVTLIKSTYLLNPT